MKLSEQLKNVLDLCDNSVDLVFEYNECTYVIDLDNYCYIIDNNNSLEDYMGKSTFSTLFVNKFDVNKIHVLKIPEKYGTFLCNKLCTMISTKLIMQVLKVWYDYKLNEYMEVVNYNTTMCTNLVNYVTYKLIEINNSNGYVSYSNAFAAINNMNKKQFMEYCYSLSQHLYEDLAFDIKGYESLQDLLDSYSFSDLFINVAYNLGDSTYIIFEDVNKSIVYNNIKKTYRMFKEQDAITLESNIEALKQIDIPINRISAIGFVIDENEWELKREVEVHLLIYLLDLDKYFDVVKYDTENMLDIIETFIHFTHYKNGELNILDRIANMNKLKVVKKLQHIDNVVAATNYLIGFSAGYIEGYTENK